MTENKLVPYSIRGALPLFALQLTFKQMRQAQTWTVHFIKINGMPSGQPRTRAALWAAHSMKYGAAAYKPLQRGDRDPSAGGCSE